MSAMSTLVTAQDETLDRRKGREKLRHVGGVRAVPLAVLVAEEALLAPRLEREQREERHGEQQPLEGERDQTKAEAGREQASVPGEGTAGAWLRARAIRARARARARARGSDLGMGSGGWVHMGWRHKE